MKHFGNIILVMLFVAVLTALFGRYRPFIVMSDSMYPTLKKNMIIIGERVTNKESIQKGDICVYVPKDGFFTITHRIVEEHSDGYVFKGDNNESADEDHISFEQIRYKIIRTYP